MQCGTCFDHVRNSQLLDAYRASLHLLMCLGDSPPGTAASDKAASPLSPSQGTTAQLADIISGLGSVLAIMHEYQ